MILFIDTHDELITVALKNNDDIYEKEKVSEYKHSVFTMPMIEELFKESNTDIKDVKKIIVVNGPGSFTGIRIGLSIAKTIAYALNIEINTISSLTAYLISNDNGKKRKAVIEDSKGYYISAFDENNKSIVDEYYSTEDDLDLPCVPKKILVSKIIDYCDNMPSENPHHVKANYVKKIEVHYDK
jgi:tRNA threonylcarbamoyl adenosine modification protein YeaZ